MMPPLYNFTEYFMLTDKLSIIYGEEERVAAFDLRRETSQVAQLYSLFVLPERTEDQRASSWFLSHRLSAIFFTTHRLLWQPLHFTATSW